MSIATLAWTIYNDQRNRTPPTPPPELIARQVRITLRDQDTSLPPGTERITEIVATEITRQASPSPVTRLRTPEPGQYRRPYRYAYCHCPRDPSLHCRSSRPVSSCELTSDRTLDWRARTRRLPAQQNWQEAAR